ncbi:MAG: hypothetical protein HPY50_20290 [Firmicutes bacterium]|nr:hypothetical protein [Bacillota bacterium]
MIVLEVLLIAIAVLIVLLLAAPFEASLRGAWPESSALGRASWGGVLVVFRLEARPGGYSSRLAVLGLTVWKSGGRPGTSGSEAKAKPEKPEKPKPKKKGTSSGGTLRMLKDRELWREAISFLRRLVRALRLEAKVDGAYGTDDAALTGILAGIIAVLGGSRVMLNLQPVFVEEVLDVEGYAKTRFFIGELIWIVLALLWKRPVRRLWMPKIKAKFRLKEAGQHVY